MLGVITLKGKIITKYENAFTDRPENWVLD
jgi:hypothetical protein